MHSNFLVSCVGAYHDSGIGTGGLVLAHKEGSIVIDSLDSTGLCVFNNIYYRYIRSTNCLIGYDVDGIKSTLRLPNCYDVHDIYIDEEGIICVSTGTNEILYYNHHGKLINAWKASGEKDAWHLNCLEKKNGHLFFSAFGKFVEHRGWNIHGSSEKGFVMNLSTGEYCVDRLSGPHHPRFFDGNWYVCNSNKNSIRIVDSNKIEQEIDLGGFTRGLQIDNDFIYVGVSANRKVDVDGKAQIKILNRHSLALLHSIEVPFPEIYDLLIIDNELAERILNKPNLFKLESESVKRVGHLENQVRLGLLEIKKLTEDNICLRKNNNSPSLFRRVTNKIKSFFK
jgi:hypothetical protein